MRRSPCGDDAIDAAVSERDAAGFVAVSRGAGPTSRYLTGREFDCDLVFVRVDGEMHLRVPSTVEPPSLPVASVRVDDRSPRTTVAAVLAEHGASDGTVLAPWTVPHDAALHLESAGYDLASAPAAEAARAAKDDAECDAIEAAQHAATRGVGRAAAILSAATVEEADDGDDNGDDEQSVLHWDGAPLSTERLRRQVDATLAAEGVDAAGATTVRAGPRGDGGGGEPAELRPGEPIVASVGPRGPAGYRGALTRTFAVDPDGGWEHRAHIACDATRKVSLAETGPGNDAGFLGSELRAETAAFGFSMADEVTGDVGGGTGLAAREDPPLDGDRELIADSALRVCAAVTHADHGRVELTNVLVVGDDGPRLLGGVPTGFDPSHWQLFLVVRLFRNAADDSLGRERGEVLWHGEEFQERDHGYREKEHRAAEDGPPVGEEREVEAAGGDGENEGHRETDHLRDSESHRLRLHRGRLKASRSAGERERRWDADGKRSVAAADSRAGQH